ncbi:MAG: GNAT family N-acetyltransferase [Treponema sp.]|jgi:GNAT superfamily N-acetyltransferase|nr:GNAT family N-acetyltransferase [Treponema sp.]
MNDKMTNKQYAELINRGHFLYWDMLGKLRGIENHHENGLRWLTGDVTYTYSVETSDINHVMQRIKNKEIPDNLLFLTDNLEENPEEVFMATGFFKSGSGSTGMAHELLDTPLPKPDKRLNLFRIKEISQLKMAGAVLNGVFGYRLFSFEHYIEMMENEGQFFYLAEYDGLPAGVCMSQHGDIFINISWVATLPGYRKLGIAGYLIQKAERDGIQCGKKIGVLQGRPDAVNAYRRIGYRDYCKSIDLDMKI